MTATTERRLSLGARIFIAFSVLFALGIGVAAGVTFWRGNAIADAAVSRELENIRDVQHDIEAQRFRQLELIAELFAADPYFSSYVAEATGNGLGVGDQVDTASIADQLAERRLALGFDLALVLDSAGTVIAGTGFVQADGEDLTNDSLIGPVIANLVPASGYWFRSEGAFHVATVPLAEQDYLVGFLVAGYAVDRDFVEEIRRISGSEMALFQHAGDELSVVASTLPEKPTRELLAQAPHLIPGPEPLRLVMDNRTWLALASGKGAAKEGLAVALTSVDDAFAPFRAIENILLLTAGLTLLLALPISFALSRKLLGPVKKLALVAQNAARGDYNQRFEHFGNDEIGRLTYAFDTLLNDLRQKTDMENYLSDLASVLPDERNDQNPEPTRLRPRRLPAKQGSVALLGLELRKFARAIDTNSGQETLDRFNASLERITTLIDALDGRILAVSGQRILVVFEGDGNATTAAHAAGVLMMAMDSRNDGLAAVVVTGDTIGGSAAWSSQSHENHLGPSVAQLDRLLSEAPASIVLLSRDAQSALVAAHGDIGIKAVAGLIQKDKSFYGLEQAKAAELSSGANLEEDATLIDTTRVNHTQALSRRIEPGVQFGARYEIISELGVGGMGAVYKAHDHELNEVVALKVIKPEFFDADGQALELLKSEIRLARRITHPNVLRTHDFGEINNVPFISMEYVRGITLKHLLRQKGSLPLSAGLRVSRQLTAGLAAAHFEGVLHRDIKPDNLILQQSGNSKLMDFGIAQKTRDGSSHDGMVVGTPRYASPEQLQGLPTDARTDIYAAGVVMYELFTGRNPFSGRSIEQLLRQKMEMPPPPAAVNATLPPALSDIVMQCLAAERKDRPASADALLQTLEALRR
ncbi:MAG TPA: protein kinase [Gammaproteobacteria bacterium]